MSEETPMSLAEALRSEFALSNIVDRIELKVEAAEGPPLAGLTEEERSIYLLFWFVQDVLNGGLFEALMSSSGDHIREMAAFVGMLNCPEFAEIFGKCAGLFDAARVSEMGYRREVLVGVGRAFFEPLDGPFFHRQDALDNAAVAFVAANGKQFHLPVDDRKA